MESLTNVAGDPIFLLNVCFGWFGFFVFGFLTIFECSVVNKCERTVKISD